MAITIKSLGYGKVAVLHNGKHVKTFTGMSAPNDARQWVANQYKASEPDSRTGSLPKNENTHLTAADIYRQMQEGNLKGNQEKIDANKNGKIDSEDFKILRSKKKDTCEADCKESVEHLEEKLTSDQPVSKWIEDFVNSDNPKFAGKSKEERRQMALGAYYAAKRQNEDVELDEASYEKDMDEKKPVFAQGVKGVKSKPFTKKFKTMGHYNKWADSEASEDHEVHRVYQESVELAEVELDEDIQFMGRYEKGGKPFALWRKGNSHYELTHGSGGGQAYKHVKDWHDTSHEDVHSELVKSGHKKISEEVESLELDEGTLMVSRHRSYARPGQGPEAYPITKDHGEASDGSRVYSVKQPNGFHGVLAVKGDTVVGSSRNNLSKDEAHKMGDHYVKHGTVGIGVGKHWSIGSGIHGKVVKEDVELDEGLRLVSKHGDGQHTAKVYKDNEWGEYRVKFFKDGKHVGEDGDYHTDDLDDAKSTADSQIKRYNAKNEDTQSELGSHPDGYVKVGQRWKKAQKQDQQGKPEKSYEYADKPATGLTKEDLTFSNMDFTGEIVRESIEVVMNSDTTSYDACFHLVKHMMQTEDIDLEFLEAVDQLYQNKAELFEIYTRHEVEQRVAQHKKAGNKVSDVRYSIKQGQPYAEYVVTLPDGTQRKYIYHGSVVKHERM